MQERLHNIFSQAAANGGADAARDARLLPGPLDAAEQAARDARLVAAAGSARFSGARLMVGAAAVAVAVTVPDLSVGAMSAPLITLDASEPERVPLQPIWTPSAGSTGPVYAPVMAAEEIAPAALTFSSRTGFAQFERAMPLDFLETGSERFDLAFAGVAMPNPAAITISAGLPEQPRGEVTGITGTLRTRVIDVPQISGTQPLLPRVARQAQPAGTTLSASNAGNRSLAIANESVEAAFAGQLDVSGDIRRSLPVEQPQRSQAPAPSGVETARVVPIPVPDAGLASSREEQIELVQKTQLDARVNGVRTGSVDFEQRDGTIALRLGSVIDMLANRFTASELAQLRSGRAIDSYLTLAQLQAAGIPIQYDAVYDEVEFGIDYDDAPQAAKVQVEQIGAPTSDAQSVMIDQIPR